MARVTGTDLKGVFTFLQTAVAGTRDDPIPTPTLAALGRLIPADLIAYFEIRRADRATLAFAASDIADATPDPDALLAFGHQNPLSSRYPWRPADGALRLSTATNRRDLEKTEFYQFVMVPVRIRDSMKAVLWSTADTVACVALDRCESDFTQRDENLLRILQQHLIRWRAQALAGWLPATSDDVGLTVREADVLTWAARGMTNDDVARVLGTSPSTVGKHLENAYVKLGVHSRAEALGVLAVSGPYGPRRPVM